jgi:hypothetical protein
MNKNNNMHDNHDVVLKLSSYRGKQEKRVVPPSIRSMRNERGVSCADLHEISSGLLKDDDACGCGLSCNEQFIPSNKGLSVSGVRKELETAADKLQLFQTAPELVIQMLEHAVKDYKLLLKRLMAVVKIALKEYTSDMVSTGELDADDIEVLNTHVGQAVVVASDGFREFFLDWIANDAPKSCKSIYKRAGALKLESIFNIAKLGTIDINDATLSKTTLAKHFFADTKYHAFVSIVDKMLILHDSGFRYYVGGLGGKHVYYWDWVRNNANAAQCYSGQL